MDSRLQDGAVAEASGQPPQRRRITAVDIALVQNLVERCLLLYMNEIEVVAILQQQAQIEPGFTRLVWKKLEEQNREFFAAYKNRLELKEQVQIFNSLLEEHSQPLLHGGGKDQWLPLQPGDALAGAGRLSSGGSMQRIPSFGALSNAAAAVEMTDSWTNNNLSTLPRNFSLSDLSADLAREITGAPGGEPSLALPPDGIGIGDRKFSLSDMMNANLGQPNEMA
mmetsp:Transcript_25696/g.84584  ORF Transcript_25696/g.84584 Transcript_25696/m.84584 type:complete len:224 (+) Transcript_25696:1-672(+)|eukprot:CAMPEP_0170138360 /NCGR_PEP_ID=MMETSP0033_2-20121228/4856_1 /TAXON_ID=195969 /ORGANISM="Dolichomastix tenuilepis, Strain CCMP3274" /LENGTH=223 /DNA_ID=CAMNT_0010374363 /DNA_START=1 /DNA_END=672 /DNA_ORIENTATION=-